MDDGILWDSDTRTLVTRVKDVAEVLKEWGLEFNVEKCQWYKRPHAHAGQPLHVTGHVLNPSPALEVMGLSLAGDSAPSNLIAPLMAMARGKFWSIKPVLCRCGNISKTIGVMQSVVAGASLWCVAAILPDAHAVGLVSQTQVQCVMCMMRRGRRAGESWVEQYIRVCREARAVIHTHMPMWLSRLWHFRGIAPEGCVGSRELPLASSVIHKWRDLAWWQEQQNRPDGVRHPARFFPRLTQLEKKMDAAAQGSWRSVAQDGLLWREREQRWLWGDRQCWKHEGCKGCHE